MQSRNSNSAAEFLREISLRNLRLNLEYVLIDLLEVDLNTAASAQSQ
jgi:hypothetical protein